MPRWNSASKLGCLNLSTTVIGSGVSIDSIEAKKRLVLVGRFLRGVALEGKLHVLRRERLVVLELDVRLQREGQRLEIGREVPFLGEQRRHREVLVDLRQALENVVMRDLADRRRRRGGRIEPRRLEHHADRHAVLGEGNARRRDKGKTKCGEKAVGAAHGTLRGWERSLSIAPLDARASSRSPSSRSGEKGLAPVAAAVGRGGRDQRSRLQKTPLSSRSSRRRPGGPGVRP